MGLNRLEIIALLFLACLDFAAALFAWRGFAAAEPAESQSAHEVSAIVPTALAEAPIMAAGDERETLARPLFAKSRRPLQSTPHAARETGAAPPPAGLKLLAIVGFSHSARAFVTSNAEAGGKWLRVGEIFENWTVDAIAAQEIALRQDAGAMRIGFAYDGLSSSANSAPSPFPSATTEPAAPQPAKIVIPTAFEGMRSAKRGGY